MGCSCTKIETYLIGFQSQVYPIFWKLQVDHIQFHFRIRQLYTRFIKIYENRTNVNITFVASA
jgi:hypothetical protein